MLDARSPNASSEHPSPSDVDPHGQAALLLVESLIFTLLDNGSLTKEQVLEAVDSPGEVKDEKAKEIGEPRRILAQSLDLIHKIGVSVQSYSGQDVRSGLDSAFD